MTRRGENIASDRLRTPPLSGQLKQFHGKKLPKQITNPKMITTHNMKGVCVHSHTKTQTNPGPSGGCKQLQRSSILQLPNIVILFNRFVPSHPVYESTLIVMTKNSDSHIQARGKKGKKIQEEDNSVFAKFHLRTLCSAPNTKFLHSFCRHNT